MRTPIPWTIYGDRGVNLDETIPIVGRDFTGATYRCQVRLTPDAPGSALISPVISLTYGGTDTVANHIAAGRINAKIEEYVNPATNTNYAPGDSVPLSLVHVHVDNSLMKAPDVPAAIPLGDDVTLAWDLLITPSGGSEDKWVAGGFVVRGTVVQ